jgi:nitrate/nitrite transport system substrate-binding protein
MSQLPATGITKTHDAFDADRPLMLRCACGQDHAPQAHDMAVQSQEDKSRDFMEAALVKALFPVDSVRRGFLKAVGVNTARAAIASVLPMGALQAMAQERGPLEKKDLKIGFIAITCASPLIMADPLGFYKKEGLNVQLMKTAGWALIRDKMINKEHDASHFLSPMPLAMSMGLGSNQVAMNVASIQNTNGQAITLHVKHKDKRDPKSWKGFKFAVPFEYSMHNFLLRYYLAENGLNPDTDVQIRVTPPPEMVANLRAGNIDGFLGPDPFNQRAVYDEVGFIHILSKEIWDGHPCCAFGVSDDFIKQNPNSFAALYRAVLTASFMASQAKDRELIAKVIAPAQYLNQPEAVLQAGADRQVCRWSGQHQERTRPRQLRPGALAEHGRVDADPDEALGLCEGRRQLQADCRESIPADRRQEADVAGGLPATRGGLPQVQGHGQGV